MHQHYMLYLKHTVAYIGVDSSTASECLCYFTSANDRAREQLAIWNLNHSIDFKGDCLYVHQMYLHLFRWRASVQTY